MDYCAVFVDMIHWLYTYFVIYWTDVRWCWWSIISQSVENCTL